MNYDYPFFNQYLKIPDNISKVVDSLYAAEKEEVRYCQKLIVLNLLLMGKVACSKSKRFYTRNHTQNYTQTYFIKALKILVEDGFVEECKSGYRNEGFKEGYSTLINFKGRLITSFNPSGKTIRAELDVFSLPLFVVEKYPVYDKWTLKQLEKIQSVKSNKYTNLISKHNPTNVHTSQSTTQTLSPLWHLLDTNRKLNREYAFFGAN